MTRRPVKKNETPKFDPDKWASKLGRDAQIALGIFSELRYKEEKLGYLERGSLYLIADTERERIGEDGVCLHIIVNENRTAKVSIVNRRLLDELVSERYEEVKRIDFVALGRTSALLHDFEERSLQILKWKRENDPVPKAFEAEVDGKTIHFEPETEDGGKIGQDDLIIAWRADDRLMDLLTDRYADRDLVLEEYRKEKKVR